MQETSATVVHLYFTRPVLPGLNLCQDNMTPTVPGFRADMLETSATVVHVSFTRPVLPGLNLCQDNMTPTVPGFRADMQETSATVVHMSFTRQGLAIPPSPLSSWHTCLIDRKGRAPVRRARPCEEGAPKFA
jgi:hypothetical protein